MMDSGQRRTSEVSADERAGRVLIVAHRSALDQSLLAAVAHRASASPADFTLLIPALAHGLHRLVDPEDQDGAEAEGLLEAAIPAVSAAAGAPITGMVGGHDPLAAAWDALNLGAYDEVIVAAESNRLSRLLRIDLPRRIAGLGVPVTVVSTERGEPASPGLPQAA